MSEPGSQSVEKTVAKHNRDPRVAVGRLTSNVAERVLEVVRRGSSSGERYRELCEELGVRLRSRSC